MFWRMAGLSSASPVETILDKSNFTLEELLDEDEIIQECKALNGRLINFLREKPQVEQLIRFIVEEPPEEAEKRRTFKIPFIACEIFTCEVDIILKTLVENEDLLNLLFSFLDSNRSHSTLSAGYFSKVVICLLLRKTVPFMKYLKTHQEIIKQLVDLIGITSVMEVLIRLIGADEHVYTNYADAMQCNEKTDILEMIVDKFGSSDSAEVHANAAETLCALARLAPPALASKITNPNFVGRLFHHALEESRPKSVLINVLSICISLLDPKRSALSGSYYLFNRQLNQTTTATASPETVEGMLGSLGGLLKILDASPTESILLTTYGKLQPPFGKHRLKVIEFISVLLSVGGEAAEKELIRLGAVGRIVNLFFEYPYNNFLHHHVENIVSSCLESKNTSLVKHLICECNLVEKILEVEENPILSAIPCKPTAAAEGRKQPTIGNMGHLTRISNKLVQLTSINSEIQPFLQENDRWNKWQMNELTKRNATENVNHWVCGRPTSYDRRDSDDEDFQDKDYNVAALANNLSQAFRYGIYNNDDADEVHDALERDDEDVYFDDESAEVVISSLRLGDDQGSGSLFTNSNWFAFEDEKGTHENSADGIVPPSPDKDVGHGVSGVDNVISASKGTDLDATITSRVSEQEKLNDAGEENRSKDVEVDEVDASNKSPAWIECREAPDSNEPLDLNKPLVLEGGAQKESENQRVLPNSTNENNPSCSSTGSNDTDGNNDVKSAVGTDETSKAYEKELETKLSNVGR